MRNSISIKLYSILFFLCSTISVFADESNPEEPPEDVTVAPISDHLWILFLVGILYIFLKLNPSRKFLLTKK